MYLSVQAGAFWTRISSSEMQMATSKDRLMEKWKCEFIRFHFPYSASRLRIERAFVVKHPHIPSLLYKYRSFSDRHKDALKDGTLWLSSPDKFNDPYDSSVYFDINRFLVEDQSPQDFITSAKEMIAARAAGKPWTRKPITKPIQQGEWRRKTARDLLASVPPAQRDVILREIDADLADQAERHVRTMSEAIRKGFSVLCLAENSTSVLM